MRFSNQRILRQRGRMEGRGELAKTRRREERSGFGIREASTSGSEVGSGGSGAEGEIKDNWRGTTSRLRCK
jgi:hypothetical protein